MITNLSLYIKFSNWKVPGPDLNIFGLIKTGG